MFSERESVAFMECSAPPGSNKKQKMPLDIHPTWEGWRWGTIRGSVLFGRSIQPPSKGNLKVKLPLKDLQSCPKEWIYTKQTKPKELVCCVKTILSKLAPDKILFVTPLGTQFWGSASLYHRTVIRTVSGVDDTAQRTHMLYASVCNWLTKVKSCICDWVFSFCVFFYKVTNSVIYVDTDKLLHMYVYL